MTREKTAYDRPCPKGRRGARLAAMGGQAILLLLWGFLLFGLRSPDLLQKSASDALLMAAKQVIPVLFPMAAVGGLLTCTMSLPKPLCRLPARWLLLSDASVGVLLLSLFSGFPIGAMLASRLLESRRIGEEEASRLACYTNNASAAFLVGCVGGSFFGDRRLGWILWGASTLSALICARWMAVRAQKSGISLSSFRESREQTDFLAPAAMARSVAATAMGMLNLTAFVVFFAAFCAFLEKVLGMWLPDSPLAQLIRAGISAFFEITGGVRAISALSLPLPLRMALAGSATGWGGLSVFFQCMAAGDAAEGRRLVTVRFWMAILGGGVAFLLTLLFYT